MSSAIHHAGCLQRSELLRDHRRAVAGRRPRGRPVRLAQKERAHSQGTEVSQQRVSDHGQNAVAPGPCRRQVQLGVFGMQEKAAGQTRFILCRLQMRAGICAQNH